MFTKIMLPLIAFMIYPFLLYTLVNNSPVSETLQFHTYYINVKSEKLYRNGTTFSDVLKNAYTIVPTYRSLDLLLKQMNLSILLNFYCQSRSLYNDYSHIHNLPFMSDILSYQRQSNRISDSMGKPNVIFDPSLYSKGIIEYVLNQKRKNSKTTMINVRHTDQHVPSSHTSKDLYSKTVLVSSALISWLLVFSTSFIGLALIPLKQKRKARYIIIQFAYAMGYAGLVGDVVFHLLPHTLMDHKHENTSHDHAKHTLKEIGKMSMLFIGIIAFYFVEILLKICPYTRDHKCGCNHPEKSESDEPQIKIIKPEHTECCGDSKQNHDCVNIDTAHDIRKTSTMHRLGAGIPPDAIIDMNQTEVLSPCVGRGFKSATDDMIVQVSQPCSTTSKATNVMWILLIGDAAHNFFDGLALGSLFIANKNSLQEGIAASVAIVCHELPHKIGDIALLLKSGWSEIKATLLVASTSITSLLGVIIGLSVTDNIKDSVGPINLFTAGMFLYMALVLMMSQMLNAVSKPEFSMKLIVFCHVSGMAVGITIMIVIALLENTH